MSRKNKKSQQQQPGASLEIRDNPDAYTPPPAGLESVPPGPEFEPIATEIPEVRVVPLPYRVEPVVKAQLPHVVEGPRGVLLEETPHDPATAIDGSAAPILLEAPPCAHAAKVVDAIGAVLATAGDRACQACGGEGAVMPPAADGAERVVVACEACRGTGLADPEDGFGETVAATAARQAAGLRAKLEEAQKNVGTKKDWGRTWFESFQGAKKELQAETEARVKAERRVKELEAQLGGAAAPPAQPAAAAAPADVEAKLAAAEKRARDAEAALANVEKVVTQKVAAQLAAQAPTQPAPAAAPPPPPAAPAEPALVTSSEPLNRMLDAGRQVVASHAARATQFTKNASLANLAKTIVEVEGAVRAGA
jgi:hypothetical protein